MSIEEASLSSQCFVSSVRSMLSSLMKQSVPGSTVCFIASAIELNTCTSIVLYFFILQRYIVVMNISMWNVIFLICKKYKKSSDFCLHIFDDFFNYSDDFCLVVRRDFYFVKKTIYRFKHEFIVLFDDFFEFWELIVYDKNEVWFIITWLLADQNKVSILDFGLHTVSFCSDKKAVFYITGPNKCYRDRNFFLRIFIDDFFSFVSTLCETIDWKLNDIVVSFSDFFSNKTISVIIFDKVAFEYELIEFIQNGLRVWSSDFICNFSQG